MRSFETIEGTPPGLARVQADIQRTVDAGEIRLSKSRPGPTRPRRAGRGSVEANTVKTTVQELWGATEPCLGGRRSIQLSYTRPWSEQASLAVASPHPAGFVLISPIPAGDTIVVHLLSW